MGRFLSVVVAAVVLVVGLDVSRTLVAKSEALPNPAKVATLPDPEPVSAVDFAPDYHLSEVCDCETLTRRMNNLEDRIRSLEEIALSIPKVTAPKSAEVVATLPVQEALPLSVSARPGHWSIRDIPASRASVSQIKAHLAEHGISGTGTREELLELHDRAHEGEAYSVAFKSTPVRSTVQAVASPVGSIIRSSCPGGVCPTRSTSRTSRGIFRRW